jgi:hypothetical protein
VNGIDGQLLSAPDYVNYQIESLLNVSAIDEMADSVNHEEALVKAFIPAHRQERFLEIIAKPKKRAKLLNDLSHFKAFNPQFMVAVPPNQQNPSDLAKLLKAKGAGAKCYVMSENQDLDGHELDLETALKQGRRRSDGHPHLMCAGEIGIF